MFVPFTGRRLFLAALALGLILLPSISWATTAVIPAPFAASSGTLASTSTLGSITIANNSAAAPNTVYFGTYDVTNNAVLFVPAVQDSAHALALYNAVNDMVRSASDSGAYDSTGITSTLAGLDAAHGNNTMGVGVLLNDAGVIGDPGNPLYGSVNGDLGVSWHGIDPTQFDTLVQYTYLGDSFLRGTVDANDIFQATADKNTTPTVNTWGFGDYFYQATGGTPISGVDIFAATASKGFVNAHTYPLTVTFGQGAAGAAVPEPTSIALLVIGSLAGAIATFRMRRNRMTAR